jgi:hypothetical protein
MLSGGFLGEQVIAAGVTGYGITGGLNGEQTAVSVSALAANSCTTGTELCNINTASNLGTTNCGGYQWAYVRALVVTASTPSANGSINLEWLMGGTTSGVSLETFPGGTGTPARTDAVLPLLTSTTSQYVNSGPNPIVLPMGVYFQPVVQNLAGSAATISIYVDPVTPNAN